MKRAPRKKSKRTAQHGTSVETAFLAIRELIVMGRLAPGTWIVEADLSQKLGLSRTPVRAALQWLQHEGYVDSGGSGPKSRITVAPLTVEDARELYMIVGQIEGMAGSNTASLSRKERDPVVSNLRAMHAEMVKLAASRDPDHNLFFDKDNSFHSRIVEAGAGPRLRALYDSIAPQTERYWRFYLASRADGLTESCKEHEAILHAIAAGDAEGTSRALQANWENGAKRLEGLILRVGERGSW